MDKDQKRRRTLFVAVALLAVLLFLPPFARRAWNLWQLSTYVNHFTKVDGVLLVSPGGGEQAIKDPEQVQLLVQQIAPGSYFYPDGEAAVREKNASEVCAIKFYAGDRLILKETLYSTDDPLGSFVWKGRTYLLVTADRWAGEIRFDSQEAADLLGLG